MEMVCILIIIPGEALKEAAFRWCPIRFNSFFLEWKTRAKGFHDLTATWQFKHIYINFRWKASPVSLVVGHGRGNLTNSYRSVQMRLMHVNTLLLYLKLHEKVYQAWSSFCSCAVLLFLQHTDVFFFSQMSINKPWTLFLSVMTHQ